MKNASKHTFIGSFAPFVPGSFRISIRMQSLREGNTQELTNVAKKHKYWIPIHYSQRMEFFIIPLPLANDSYIPPRELSFE